MQRCLTLAPLSTVHASDMKRCLGKHKTKLWRVLELVGSTARDEWHANNSALRGSLQGP